MDRTAHQQDVADGHQQQTAELIKRSEALLARLETLVERLEKRDRQSM